MKIGYKGFDKDLKCRNEQFAVGGIYTKPEKDKPRLCSDDGYHYCDKLDQVFSHYSNKGSNRFCEIEILGNFSDDYDKSKSITTSFKIIREITLEIDTLACERNLNLDLVQKIQTKYPLLHVGGSTALFLHGVRLKRWASKSSDLDFVSPYFFMFEAEEEWKEDNGDIFTHMDAKASGNDFDETFIIGQTKIDYKIDPKQRYEIIEYKGFKYKVSTVEIILEAKARYALNGQTKHKEDLREIAKAGSR